MSDVSLLGECANCHKIFSSNPNLVPNALSKLESASTINASIKTCLVLTSISLITLSTTSKSFSFPRTIIDRVVFSSVTCIGI